MRAFLSLQPKKQSGVMVVPVASLLLQIVVLMPFELDCKRIACRGQAMILF
jgi:hypothetical protein